MANRRNNGKNSRKASRPTGESLDIKLNQADRLAANGRPRTGAKSSGSATGKAGTRTNSDRRKKNAGRSNGNSSGRRTGRGYLKTARTALYWSVTLGIWAFVALAVLVGYHAAQLPQMSSWRVPERPPSVRIIDANAALIANRGATGGEAMRLGDMSPYIPKAVIAIEDRRFKKHFGVDPIGLVRAMAVNLIEGDLVQGGSTITQQLAKNLFLEPDRTIGRKVQEAILALWLETRFTKDEILELYLNRVYFGAGAYGVDAAARRYFDKSAGDLTLAEAAMLAGLLKAPSRLSPTQNRDGAERRAQTVLAAMQDTGFVTDREAASAMSMQAARARSYRSGSRHYVADMVMKRLSALIGETHADIIVETTIDLGFQANAGKIISETIEADGGRHEVTQGALVAMAGDGAIRALVGGKDYSESQFNRAVDARRQPGSAFKPFVFLAALEAGRTPQSVMLDTPIRIGNWAPENYRGEYHGRVTLRQAMAKSMNSVAAQLVVEAGADAVVAKARRLGIRSELKANASIALGTSEVTLLELASAYAPFANGGYRAIPYLIDRVRTRDGRILYERKARSGAQLVQARELSMMNDMLSEVVRSGTGQGAQMQGWQVAGKTGTSQNSRDALFVGYTPMLVTAIWYGNDDGSPMRDVYGGSLPARSWAKFMTAAHRGLTPRPLPGGSLPAVAAVPQFRPNDETVDGGARHAGQGPRPGRELGRSEKPRGILDLLFGSDTRQPG